MARLLYFARLVDPLDRQSEQMPTGRLRARGGDRTGRLRDDAVRATLDRKPACRDDRMADGDNVGRKPARR
jgi:hypothetical protein